MHSIYTGQLVRSVAAPLVKHMHGHLRGVATVWNYAYPAQRIVTQKDLMILNGFCFRKEQINGQLCYFPLNQCNFSSISTTAIETLQNQP